ncbi:hypothetical protein [Geomonas sp.]|uniref:hypothetical protein n=1 Tax=Geomonas sp. TaxID=2651584 RepID=UPI002B49DB74|nr:hypothetical protein [Geomonas sp.]HJV34622.1 hypothetical protein [Geomonas sp.]
MIEVIQPTRGERFVRLVLTRLIKVLVAVVLLTPAACAHQRQADLIPFTGKTAASVEEAGPSQKVQTPGSGMLSASGRGVRAGSLVGAGAGTQCGYLAILCMPAFGVVGALGGGVYGAVAAEPKSLLEEAERVLYDAIAEAEIGKSTGLHLVEYAKENGHTIELAPAAVAVTSGGGGGTALGDAGYEMILQVSDIHLVLLPAPVGVTEVIPRRRLLVQAQVRLLSAARKEVVADRIVTSTLGSTLELKEWVKDHGQALRKETQAASRVLAEEIVSELFLLQKFPVRTISARAPLFELSLSGVMPIHPALPNGPADEPSCESVMPTLEWEPYPGEEVSYDLKIWERYELTTGVLVYHRERLETTSHKLEEPLQPARGYVWSIRVHFRKDGRSWVTEWSSYQFGPNLTGKVMTMGLAPQRGQSYYYFRTPKSSK